MHRRNDRTVTIIIPGKPLSKARPRFSKKTGHAYNSQHDVMISTEEWIRENIGKEFNPFMEVMAVDILHIFARPKFHFGTGKNAGILKQSAPWSHDKKPDTDNLAKYYLDCLNERAYKDDCLIVTLTDTKVYSDDPLETTGKTIICVTPLTMFEYRDMVKEVLVRFNQL